MLKCSSGGATNNAHPTRVSTEPCDLLTWDSDIADPAERPKRQSANVPGRRESELAKLEKEKELVSWTVDQMIAGVCI